MEDRKFLGEERIGSLLFRLALPTVVAQLVNMLYNIVDRIYIGHIEGTGALALTGVGVCLPLILIVSAFAALISSGGGPRASIMMGHNDYAKAEQILGNSFTMQIIISAFLTVLLLLFNEKILLLFGASENTIGYATTYMNIYALGTVFVQITLGMNSFITAQGFAKTSMLSVVIGAITNIVLDPLFIFVFDMGVAGAAIATVISQAASTIWVMLFLTGRRTSLRIRRKYFRLDKAVCLSVLSLGLASFIMQASESVINICFNSNLLRYGGDLAVGAMTILSSVMQFAMLPLQGLGQGAQPIISYNFGAGLKNRVKSAFKYLLITDFTFSMLLFLLVQFFPSAFAMMFTDDPELIAYSSSALRIFMGSTGIFGIQMACQSTFTSIGNAKSSSFLAILRKIILLVPLIFIMPLIITSNPTMGIYLAEPIADFISVSCTIAIFSFQFRKALRLMDERKTV